MHILISVLLLAFAIFIHEMGHYLAAKLVGIPVYKFSLGMGPRLFGFKFKETDFRLSLFPLGGFVETPIKYEEPWRQFIMVAGGPLMSILFPVLPLMYIWIISNSTFTHMIGGYFYIVGLMFIGIAKFVYGLIVTTAITMGQISSPIGMTAEMSSSENWLEMFFKFVLTSAGIGIFNLLPIPPLDGGKLVITTIEMVTRKRLSETFVVCYSVVGFLFVLTLITYGFVHDIVKLVWH